MERVNVDEVFALAVRAHASGQKKIALALYKLADSMVANAYIHEPDLPAGARAARVALGPIGAPGFNVR